MTLTEFLLERIAEDEAGTRTAATAGWEVSRGGDFQTVYLADGHAVWGGTEQYGARGEWRDNSGIAHISRWDPARVLAECEAKRQAIEAAWTDHVQIESEWGSGCGRKALEANNDQPMVVRHLAQPYADHPDFRPEWSTIDHE